MEVIRRRLRLLLLRPQREIIREDLRRLDEMTIIEEGVEVEVIVHIAVVLEVDLVVDLSQEVVLQVDDE